MKNRKLYKNRFKVIIGGTFIGLINGFLGGGGGMLCVPILEKCLNLDNKTSHSTALLVMLPLSIVSGAVYIFRNSVDGFTLGFCAIGVVFGGIVGAFLLKKLPSQVVRFIFAVLVLGAGIRILVKQWS